MVNRAARVTGPMIRCKRSRRAASSPARSAAPTPMGATKCIVNEFINAVVGLSAQSYGLRS
jgi:hypothetical protein